MARYRNFCFTLNNPAKNGGLDLWHTLANKCSYYVMGFEIGEQGTCHWQGYAELKERTMVSVVNKWAGWHTAHRYEKSSAAAAAKYCKKDLDYVEEGIISAPGKRNDIVELREIALDEGMAAVADRATSMQQFKLVETWMNYHSPARDPAIDPVVTYIHGPSGAGKSRMAFEMAKASGVPFFVKDDSPWWTGYNGETLVIMDDFRDSWMTHNMFIKLVDRYPMRVKIHGNLVQLRASNWILTSVHPPDQLYSHTPDEPRMQVSRRINSIIKLLTEGPNESASYEVDTDGAGGALDEFLDAMCEVEVFPEVMPRGHCPEVGVIICPTPWEINEYEL